MTTSIIVSKLDLGYSIRSTNLNGEEHKCALASHRNPTHRHSSEASATSEAERLARLHPGETFVVLESVCARRVDDMLRLDMRQDREVPF